MKVVLSDMIYEKECEQKYLKDIFSYLDFDDTYNFIVARINKPQEVEQYRKCINPNKKNILILKSDEHGIDPKSFSEMHLVFRMYNNNSILDYEKVFPIPCGYSTYNLYRGGRYESINKEKINLSDRQYDIFYSEQRSPKRSPMINAINKLGKKYNSLIQETNRFGDGFNLIDYYNYLSNSKIALVPEGAVIPESFRYFESFERNCIVITTFPRTDMFDIWYYENSPAIFLNSWSDLTEEVIDTALNNLSFYDVENKKYFDSKISPKSVANYMQRIIDSKV